MSTKLSLLKNELDKYNGVARMKQTWLCRTFLPPGRRLKVHPHDLYPNGVDKGGIAERWFCSMGAAETGKTEISRDTMSFFYLPDDEEGISFREAIEQMGNDLLGKETMDTLGGFLMFSKFYDYGAVLPHHMHPLAKDAARIGLGQKPESYYFPVELNSITYDQAYTFFGFVPGTTKEQVAECLRNYKKYDNEILTMSQAYKIKLGTGWFLPAGIVHAPACVVTYEPQYLSDVSVWFQNVVNDKYYMNWEDNKTVIPKDYKGDMVDYIVDMMDWEANIDPDFRKKRYHEPIPVRDEKEMLADGYFEKWISYGSKDFAAKHLTIMPGQTVTIKDDAAYGFVLLQGYGSMNGMEINTPAIIRVGQVTADEGFVIKEAAEKGVTIVNPSAFSPIVMLKHFNGDSKEALSFVGR